MPTERHPSIDGLSRRTAIVSLAGALTGCADMPGPAKSDGQTPSATGWNPAALEELAAYVQAQKTTGFLIFDSRRLVMERNWPLPDSAATFRTNWTHGTDAFGGLQEDVASLQKSFVGLLVAVAVDKGLLDVRRPVSSYIRPGWSKAGAAHEGAVTVLHLLEMTSGLTEPLTSEAPPGTRFYYNTPAYAILKPVLEAVSGLSLDAISRRWVTEPAGLSDTLWRQRPASFGDVGNPTGLYTTPRDMARMGQLVLDKGVAANGRRVISEAQLAALFTLSSHNPAYGRLWWLNGSAYNLRFGQPAPRFETALIPAAPADLIVAFGALGRKIYISPGRQWVVVRTGQANTDPQFDQQLWLLLTRAAPK